MEFGSQIGHLQEKGRQMIRKNSSLNCSCIEGALCPNGEKYKDEIYEGRIRCQKIEKVLPIDMVELQKSILIDEVIASIGNPIPTEMAVRENRTSRTEELFDATYTASTETRGDKWVNINSDNRIDELRNMSDCFRIVELLPNRKPIVDRINAGAIFAAYPVLPVPRELYQANAVKEIDRLESMRNRLGIDDEKIEIPDAFLACDTIPDYDYTADDNEASYLVFECMV